MRITDSKGNVIPNLKEWKSRIRPRHWKQGRSAYSLADFILNRDGCAHLKSQMSSLFTKLVTFENATPEYQAPFDSHRGNRSNLDLGITGRVGSTTSLFVGVEAKVDEAFGRTVRKRYSAAVKRRESGKSTNADKRVVDLLSRYFSDTDDPPSSKFADVGYQLLTGTAGTVAVGKAVSVFYVLVFKTCLYDEQKGLANQRNYDKFIDATRGKRLMLDGEGFYVDELTLDRKPLICVYDHVVIPD